MLAPRRFRVATGPDDTRFACPRQAESSAGRAGVPSAKGGLWRAAAPRRNGWERGPFSSLFHRRRRNLPRPTGEGSALPEPLPPLAREGLRGLFGTTMPRVPRPASECPRGVGSGEGRSPSPVVPAPGGPSPARGRARRGCRRCARGRSKGGRAPAGRRPCAGPRRRAASAWSRPGG